LESKREFRSARRSRRPAETLAKSRAS
jgi:hypothetical protein